MDLNKFIFDCIDDINNYIENIAPEDIVKMIGMLGSLYIALSSIPKNSPNILVISNNNYYPQHQCKQESVRSRFDGICNV